MPPNQPKPPSSEADRSLKKKAGLDAEKLKQEASAKADEAARAAMALVADVSHCS